MTATATVPGHVFTGVDHAMEDAAVVMLDSLLLHNPGLAVDLFHYGDITLAKFSRLPVRLRQVAPPGLGATRFLSAALNDAIALRLLALDTLLAERHCGPVLYLDADVLVQADLAPLFAIAMPPGICLAAASDYLYNDPASPLYPAFDPHHAHRMRHNPNYFNAGVMLLHLEGLRQRLAGYGCDSLLAIMRERYQDSMWPDQDLLNELIPDYVQLDTRRYNVRPDLHAGDLYDEAQLTSQRLRMMQADIMHFVGPFKPFNRVVKPNIRSLQVPYENYARAAERVADIVDPRFMAVVRGNLETHRQVIRRFRTLLAMERDRAS